MIRLGYLDVQRVSRPLSMGLVAITSTEAPGRRGGDKRKNYDKTGFYSDEMSNLSLSIVNLDPLSSL